MILNKVASKLRSKRALGRSVRDNGNIDNDDDDDEQIMVSQEGPWPFGQTPEVSRTDFTDLPTFRFIFLGSPRNFSQILLLFVYMVGVLGSLRIFWQNIGLLNPRIGK